MSILRSSTTDKEYKSGWDISAQFNGSSSGNDRLPIVAQIVRKSVDFPFESWGDIYWLNTLDYLDGADAYFDTEWFEKIREIQRSLKDIENKQNKFVEWGN